MAVRITLNPFILASVLALAGCASEIPAPSLGPRAVEKQPIDMPVTNGAEAENPADPALASKLVSLLAAAEAGDRDFAQQRTRAEGTVGRATGARTGDETWIAAQQALTSLDAARAPVRDAAAAIDALREDPGNVVPGNRTAIDAAAARVKEIDDAQSAAFAVLGERLR
jgi:hypothetical protein